MTDDADVSEARLHDANPGIWVMVLDAMAGNRP